MALLVTPEATLNWAWLFTPRKGKNPGVDPKFMCDLLFTPEQMATAEFAALKAAAQAAAVEKFGDKLKALIAAEKFISPFWPVARKIDMESGKLLPGYTEGGCYITIKSKNRPGVAKVTPQGVVPLIDENDIYSGCIVRASVDCYAYDNESKGVSFGLSNILKVRDGDRIGSGGGGRSDPKDDFARFAAAAPAVAGAGSAESLF